MLFSFIYFRGSYILKYPNETLSGIGECRRCHPFCDIHRSCYDDGPSNCEKCAHGGIVDRNGTVKVFKKIFLIKKIPLSV